MDGLYIGSRGGSPVKVKWDISVCTCDCLFFHSTLLPCQHLFGVMETFKKKEAFEVAQLSVRWSMKEARGIETLLGSSIRHLSKV
jgi:hypothetical protein